MFTVTWIENGKVSSVSHPKESVILSVWFGMLSKGIKGRMWNPSKQLVA